MDVIDSPTAGHHLYSSVLHPSASLANEKPALWVGLKMTFSLTIQGMPKNKTIASSFLCNKAAFHA
jgi:hypothetical protein